MAAQLSKWTIEFYTDGRGKSPVEEFIDDLPEPQQRAVARMLLLLEEFGVNLGSQYAKHIEGKIWELRPKPNRLLYFAHTGCRFIILHAFRKKTRRTQRKDIAIAERRMAEFLEREG